MNTGKKNHLGKIKLSKHIKKEWRLYSFLIIPILYFVIFKYIPMFGNIIAFRKYSGGVNIFGENGLGCAILNSFSGIRLSGELFGIPYF